MRDVGAIVEPLVTLAALEKRWAALDAREAKTLGEIRLERGRVLVDARKMFPARGPKAKGWGELLERWKVEERTARNWMALAGHVDETVSEKVSETKPAAKPPTYAEAGIVKRPASRAIDGGAAEEPVDGLARTAQPRVWTEEQRERIALDDIRQRQPPPMAVREERTRKLLFHIARASEEIGALAREGLHLSDATTSSADFESAKGMLLGIIRAGIDELEGAGALDAPEPQKRQLLMLVK